MEENQKQATKDERARTAMSGGHRATWGRASTREVAARERARARARVRGGGCEGAGANARVGGGAKGEAGGESWVGTKAGAGVVAEICRYVHMGLILIHAVNS